MYVLKWRHVLVAMFSVLVAATAYVGTMPEPTAEDVPEAYGFDFNEHGIAPIQPGGEPTLSSKYDQFLDLRPPVAVVEDPSLASH